MYIEIKDPTIMGNDDLIKVLTDKDKLKQNIFEKSREYILKMYNNGEDYALVISSNNSIEIINLIADNRFSFVYNALNLNDKEKSDIIGTIDINDDGSLISINRTNLIKNFSIEKEYIRPNNIKIQNSQPLPNIYPGYMPYDPYNPSSTGNPLPYKDTSTGDPILNNGVTISCEEKDTPVKEINTETKIKYINISNLTNKNSKESKDISVEGTTLNFDRIESQAKFMDTINRKHKEK